LITLLIVILHDLDRLPELLEAWKRANVPGVTILQSAGGFHAEKLVKRSGLGGLLQLFEQTSAQQRLLFCLIDDPDILKLAIAEADRVVGGFDRPHSGILFTLPVGEVLGLQKWEQADIEIDNLDVPTDKSAANLRMWIEKEIEERHGAKALKEWKVKRQKRITAVNNKPHLTPTIVRVETPIKDVLSAFLDNPRIPVACVVNAEERLVGLIDKKKLGEMVLIPTMPDQFIQDPDGYEKALKYAKMDSSYPASEIMGKAVFVTEDGTLEQAYLAMRSNKLEGLPVVNKEYRVTGFVTLTELLAYFFVN